MNSPGIDLNTVQLPKATVKFAGKKVDQGMRRKYGTMKRSFPEVWKQELIVKPANKGNLKEWMNSRGMKLLSIVGKILSRIIKLGKESAEH